MNFDTLIAEEQDGLTRRVARMLGGDLHAAQDVREEAFARAWQRLPRDLDDDHQRAWLRRTASNLVIDELRRRAHERFVLLLRFEGGLAHGEIARLLDISEDAARKRVARARAAFVRAYRAVSAREVGSERELAFAEAVVLTGAVRDVHSAMYGERPRSLRGEPDLANDRADLAVLRGALALDLPIVGVCRGHQLLNIATEGSLFQDVVADGVAEHSHDASRHGVGHAQRQRDPRAARPLHRGLQRAPSGDRPPRAPPTRGGHVARRPDRDDRAHRPAAGARPAVASGDRAGRAGQPHRRGAGRRDAASRSVSELTIRPEFADDAVALERLAALDSSTVPRGDALLVACVGGVVVAALRIEDEAAIADPFHPTAEIVALLAVRARQLRGTGMRRRDALRRAWARRPSALAGAPRRPLSEDR